LEKQIKKVISIFYTFLKKTISDLPSRIKRYIFSSVMFLLALISYLSFFGLSGKGGNALKIFLLYWIGNTSYLIPLFFIIFGFVFLFIPKKLFFPGAIAALSVLIGLSVVLNLLRPIQPGFISGGHLGYLLTTPVKETFGNLVTFCIFFTFIVIGSLSLWYLFSPFFTKNGKENFVSQAMNKKISLPTFKVSRLEPEQKTYKPEEAKPQGLEVPKSEPSRPKIAEFTPPPLDFLEQEKEKAHSGDVKQNAFLIKKTLENFGIEASMAEVNIGPTVTQYTLKPAEGVMLSKITALSNNLALALAAHPIRIEAPIPGKSLVGIEVPNKIRSKVRLRDLLSQPDFKKLSSTLTFTLGRDVSGTPMFTNLARLPHLLVAGATGTGKTIFLNSLILSFLYQNSPETLKFVLIDPKRVEFHVYKELPHLLCPVIFDPQGAVNVLKWLVQEMERRFKLLAEAEAKDINSFNEKVSKNGEPLLPCIILIIDELADLMAARGKEIEASIVRIAQMARAVGIHLVVATQRPSVEVITGLIKANITSRIGFQVPSQFDSRTILDASGCEKLLGLGDMLYICPESVKPRRIQGAFVSEEEVRKVVAWIKEHTSSELPGEDLISKNFEEFTQEVETEGGEVKNFKDPLYEEARSLVIRSRKASASLLQRHLQIGYARAARLLDILEARGVIGPGKGAKPREVYIGDEEERGVSVDETGEDVESFKDEAYE